MWEKEYRHSCPTRIKFPCVYFVFLKGGKICFCREVFYYGDPREAKLFSRSCVVPWTRKKWTILINLQITDL